MSKMPEELIREKSERLSRVIELKEPDRVPLSFASCFGEFMARYSGITVDDFLFNYDKTRESAVKFASDFLHDMLVLAPGAEGFIFSVAFSNHPDIAPLVRFLTGPMHDILNDKYTRWPGRELPHNIPFQFIGGEFMSISEYDDLIEDPVKFIVKTVLPRTCRALEDLGSQQAMAALVRLGMESLKFGSFLGALGADLAKVGYPSLPITFAYCPLDFIGDFLRKPTGALIDVRRVPDKVKSACEALVKPILNVALALKPAGANLAFIPLHLNEYLAPKLYNEFYWPYLKRVIVELYNNGIKSFIFFEGYHDAHLETILELPKGWGIAYFEKTDIRKAKKVLKGHSCVMGGLPISLMVSGTPEKIEEYLKDLLGDVMSGGGFILAPGVAEIPGETPIENIRAIIKTVEKHGIY